MLFITFQLMWNFCVHIKPKKVAFSPTFPFFTIGIEIHCRMSSIFTMGTWPMVLHPPHPPPTKLCIGRIQLKPPNCFLRRRRSVLFPLYLVSYLQQCGALKGRSVQLGKTWIKRGLGVILVHYHVQETLEEELRARLDGFILQIGRRKEKRK